MSITKAPTMASAREKILISSFCLWSFIVLARFDISYRLMQT